MMRLLKRSPTGDIQLITVNTDDPPPYAILSHTWTDGEEVTYDELLNGTGKDKSGYTKIRFCVDKAADEGIEHCWVDTCCIDKSDARELSTAINSMFRWYKGAKKCYVYLSDVEVPQEVSDALVFPISWTQAFRQSKWFTRGWTLQELLAPASVEFFSKEGRRLGSRISLEQEIHEITSIPVGALREQRLNDFTVEERMRWAAQRNTTIREDKIYCLLGIFEVFLPLIYGEGEAYAESRLKSEIQRRQAGGGVERLQDVPVSSVLPFPRNELFTGRENELRSLEQFLLHPPHQRISIYGLGGCGKSALAIELAYRALAQDAGRLVFWVAAMSRESFELGYREIGVRLRIPGITEENADIMKLVKEALSADNGRDWLMIVDNADDAGILTSSAGSDPRTARLYDYLPYSDRGKVIFTTRSRKAAEDLTPSTVLELRDMGKTEARALLAARLANRALLEDGRAVDELLDVLSRHALAIVQAAAFINNNDMSIAEYVSLFRQKGAEAELFGERFEDPNRYYEMESTIAKTWHISFDQIRQQDALAAEYLSFMTCIDRINIPKSLLPPGGSVVQQAKALGTLKGYAFITERHQLSQATGNERFFDVHRLVHMASVWWLEGHGEWNKCVGKAAARVEALVPYGGHEKRKVWATYLPHATHIARLAGALDDMVRASLLTRVGKCQSSLGQYFAAEMTHREELSLREGCLGREDESTLRSMNDVSVALLRQGRYPEAAEMHWRTLAAKEDVLGAKHPDTLSSMNNLAEVLGRQGKNSEAEEMHQRTLAAKEAVLGAKHPSTLTSMNNLAQVLGRQGKNSEAEKMHQRTLAAREEVLGAKHPSTLTSMNNLALVLGEQDKNSEAEEMHRRTLAAREEVLGTSHPATLTSMSNLALVLGRQGKNLEAEEMHRRTLAAREDVLGAKHPDTLTSMNNLAGVLGEQGKNSEAEKMHRQTLATREEVLGAKHPGTLTSVWCLAHLLRQWQSTDESTALYERACSGFAAVLGKDHPTTIACQRDFLRMAALQDKEVSTINPSTASHRPNMPTSRQSILSRGLAKLGIWKS